MDATGIPVVKAETTGRQGKTDGRPAHTREVKLGCVFTQTTWDEEGYPIRDSDSTTYTGAIETAEQFGKADLSGGLEAWLEPRGNQGGIGDGAEWIGTLPINHFPGAIQIVDLYHAANTYGSLCTQALPQPGVKQKRWVMVPEAQTGMTGQIEKLVGAACDRSSRRMSNWPNRSVPRPTILRRTPIACGIRVSPSTPVCRLPE